LSLSLPVMVMVMQGTTACALLPGPGLPPPVRPPPVRGTLLRWTWLVLQVPAVLAEEFSLLRLVEVARAGHCLRVLQPRVVEGGDLEFPENSCRPSSPLQDVDLPDPTTP
jgi:hypothetical protein